MERVPVTSSNVASVGFDAATGDMEVEFLGGGVYTYHNVSPERHQNLMDAPSIGKFIHAHIKPHHSFTKQS